jgi:hypothetical protein
MMKYLIPIFFISCMLFAPVNVFTQDENQCLNCHTNAKRLIEITREIAKSNPVVKETEQKGEG